MICIINNYSLAGKVKEKENYVILIKMQEYSSKKGK